MQFQLRFTPPRLPVKQDASLQVGAHLLRLHFRRHRRARRYVLRLSRDGSARITLPHGGTLDEGWAFVHRNIAWLEKQLHKRALHLTRPQTWMVGTEIWFRGVMVRLELDLAQARPRARFADQAVPVVDPQADLRPQVEHHLWRLARQELPAQVLTLANQHQFQFQRVSVRNQRSRWGSCSRRGTISLNWRLIQTPPTVRDYLILHELAHLRQMNHSRRFWREVESLCPEWAQAERWLKDHAELLDRP